MDNVIYPGIYLQRIHPNVQQNEVREYLVGSFGDIPNEIKIYKKEGKLTLLFSGIDLNYGLIRQILGKSKLHGRLPFIQTPDFGCPRDETGNIPHHYLLLHNKLKVANGDFPVLKIFHEKFMEIFGDYSKIGPVIVYNEHPDNIYKDFLAKCGRVISLQALPNWVNKKRVLGKDNTAIEYKTAIEAMQLCAVHNLRGLLSGEVKGFITKDTGGLSNMRLFRGLGPNGLVLNVEELLKRDGCIRFDELDEGIFDHDTIKLLEITCFWCSKPILPIGVDPNFRWYAGICSCSVKKRTCSRHDQKFFMMTLAPRKQKIFSFQKYRCDMINDPVIPVLPGCLPQYTDAEEFENIPFRSFQVECLENKREMHLKQTTGVVLLVTWIETLKDTRTFAIEMKVEKTSFWGLEKFGSTPHIWLKKVIEQDKPWNGKHAFEEYVSVNRGTCIISKVHGIKPGPREHQSTVIVSVDLPVGTTIMIGEKYKLFPKPNNSEEVAIRNTIDKWKLFLNRRKFEFENYRCLIKECSTVCDTTWGTSKKMYKLQKMIVHVNDSPLWEGFRNDLDSQNVYLAMDMNIPVKINGQAEVVRDTARITRIKYLPNAVYSPSIKQCCLEVHVILKENFEVVEGKSSFFPWCIRPKAVCGERYGENQTGNGNILQVATAYDPFMQKVLWVNNANSIIGDWKRTPLVDLSSMDYLLKPSKTIKHRTEIPLQVNHNLDKEKIKQIENELNESQARGVHNMLRNGLSILQGPPGTGKTTSCGYGIENLYLTDTGFIIAACPNNYSCDVLFHKLLQLNKKHNVGMKVCRMLTGYRERNRMYENEANSSKEDDNFLHVMMRKDPQWNDPELIDVLEKESRLGMAYLTKDEQGRIQSHNAKVARSVLLNIDVVVCTVVCASDSRLENCLTLDNGERRKISGLVIDEASLLVVPTVLPLLAFGSKRVWLLGDQCQLGATITNGSAIHACLGTSWMEMLLLTPVVKNNALFTMLKVQYRMADPIRKMVSEYSYGGEVESSVEVRSRKYDISRLPNFPELVGKNMCWYTYNQGHSNKEVKLKGSSSYFNRFEVSITKYLLVQLQMSGQDMSKVTIISMYQNHAQELKEMATDPLLAFGEVNVSTVDSFQGREEEVIIVNFVRSNLKFNIGFLRDKSRPTVAISRCKHYLFFVGDIQTIYNCGVPDMKRLLMIQSRLEVMVQRFKFEESAAVRFGQTNLLNEYLEKYCSKSQK